MFLDAGTLPLILYSHEQLLEKLAELKENALYTERISVDKGPAPKRRKQVQSTDPKGAAAGPSKPSVAEEPRPSDPKHAEDPMEFTESATVRVSPLKQVVDVHAEMYGFPSLAFLFELLVHLHSNYGMQLKPVSTYFSLAFTLVFLCFYHFQCRIYYFMRSSVP